MTQLRAQDYRQLFELSSVGQAQADPLMRHFLRVNRKLCALLGYPADELLATISLTTYSPTPIPPIPRVSLFSTR